MKKLPYIFIILVGCFLLFEPKSVPDNLQIQDIMATVKDKDIVIVFNSGGWGYTPFEESEDIAPIIENMQQNLEQWGYSTVIVPYVRVKDDFSGRMAAVRNLLNNFNNSSADLVSKIETVSKAFPDKKIIIAGLSVGGAFATKTYQNISEQAKGSVYAIAIGTPFWADNLEKDNIIQIDNDGKDSLVSGRISSLFFSLVKSPFKWLKANIQGGGLAFSKAFQAPGHIYYWESPEVGPKIIGFLSDKLH